ncbi:MAG: hypothetical protein IKN72_06835 [Clostridia bacterium]|nr:hypothetical protein [Clostridia bacterium]
MKKWISFVLALLLCLQFATPAFAKKGVYRKLNKKIPTILIAGDGNALYVPDETAENGERRAFYMRDLIKDIKSGNNSNGGVSDAVATVLQPFFKEGILKNNWDPYFDALEKEVSDLFSLIRLDENGNPQYGSNISKADRDTVQYDRTHDKKGDKGYYGLYDYRFWYDWRLDPMEIACQLNDYIRDVKAATGAEKVSLFSSCLGSNVVYAYVAQFGTKDVHAISINATTGNGSEFLSQVISGQLTLDGSAIVRFFESAGTTDIFSLDEFWIATIDLATKAGLLDGVSKLLHATIYDKVVEGMTSALALGTFFTMPCYWACVCNEDYETAKAYVFGKEGSAKRQQYAGLIEKIDAYHYQVAVRLPEILKSVTDSGTFLYILAKYGTQIVPLIKSNEVIGDEFTSLTRASFGATTADSIYDTLPADYIAAREAEGKGKYISPDKQVDASTCLYPDQTWFVKGKTHTVRADEENRLLYVCVVADRQLTVNDFGWTQYMVYDNATRTMSPMTEKNCQAGMTFTADKANDHPANVFVKIKLYFESLGRWLKLLMPILKEKIGEKLNLPQPDAA